MDAWAKLGNPDWTWEAFKPYLQKSCSFPGKAAEGVIKTMEPTLVDGVNNTLAQAWIDAHAEEGYEQAKEFESEQQTIGVRPFIATIDPVTGMRSSADNTYGAVAGARPNVGIVTEATVRRILFSEDQGITASGVEVDCKGSTVTVGALKEVILAAGALHTPKLLELSGVGDKERLRSLGIPVVLHSPNVGESFQNHTMGIIPVPLKDNPDLANVKPGIQALAFRQLDPDDIAEVLNQKQEWNGHEDVIKTLLQSPKEASAYSLIGMMQNLAIVVVMLTFPFSRGSVHISSADPGAPTIIDPRLLSSDLDIEFLARHVLDLRRLLSSPVFEPLIQSPREPAELAKLKTTLRESMASTAHHACGTAAMLPKECGGVVNQELKVYGTANLRIVDASVFPLIPHANPMATVYGVAERASDLIKGCCR